jgi:DNA-binding response OmpR family regulator
MSIANPPIVLVIDDEEQIRDLVIDILYNAGFKVIAAPTADDGVAIALAEPPDVILCDVVLPDALGFDTVQMLNEHPRTRHVPCILFTGYPDMLNYAVGKNIKVLRKPFSTGEIVNMITDAVRSAESIRQQSHSEFQQN